MYLLELKSAFLDELLKIAEYAPGIPEKGKITPLPKIDKPELWEFSAHPHEAKRAGRHIDLRLGNPSTGIAHSFVVPGANMPSPGGSVRVIPTNDHTIKYMDFTGTIGPGYGEGEVTKGRRTKAEVFHAIPDDSHGTKVRFNLYDGNQPEEYAIRKDNTGWYLHNKTLTRERRPDLPSSKPTYRDLDIDKLELTGDKAVMPKLDGAHTIIDLQAGRAPRVFSYRIGKKSDTGLIEHTHKIPGLLEMKVPKELDKTVLRAETIGIKDGKPIPAELTGGLLNAKVLESRHKQEESGAKLTVYPFSVDWFKGKDVSNLSFGQRKQILDKVLKSLPVLARIPIEVKKERQIELLNRVRAGLEPLSSEGVVIVEPDKEPMQFMKAKVVPDFDVFVRAVHPAISGKTGEPHERAGAFSYSWTKEGPVIGTVGGFKHEEATDMLSNPDKYVGRVAVVSATGIFKKDGELGALRQPRFSHWHLDKNEV